jgi:MFS family permease
MMLRASFGGAVCLALMGLVPNVQWLLALRFIQGTLTGTVSAAQTLVSVHTPVNRTGLALGVLSSAVFIGNMVGNMLGGLLAEVYGYRTVFYVSGVVLLLATSITWFGVREDFESHVPRNRWRSFKVGLGRVSAAWSILVLMGFMAFSRQFDQAMFPLFVQDVKGTLKGAALWTGSLHAIGSVAALLSGVILGWLADRIAPSKIGKYSALVASVLMVLHGLATGFWQMSMARFGKMFCAGDAREEPRHSLRLGADRQVDRLDPGAAGQRRRRGHVWTARRLLCRRGVLPAVGPHDQPGCPAHGRG